MTRSKSKCEIVEDELQLRVENKVREALAISNTMTLSMLRGFITNRVPIRMQDKALSKLYDEGRIEYSTIAVTGMNGKQYVHKVVRLKQV